MRTHRVVTNRTCNQSCVHCTEREPVEHRSFVDPRAVRQRMEEGRAAGAFEIEFTGGEPTMRRDLPSLVHHARSSGYTDVVLETNAALIDAAFASRLAAGGLTCVRVKLPAWDDLYEKITRDPGSFSAALAGIRAVRAAGLALELTTTLIAENLASFEALPDRFVETLGDGTAPRCWWLSIATRTPERASRVSYDIAAPVIAAFERAARAVGLSVKFHPEAAPPPCVFPDHHRPWHLFTLTPGSTRRPGHQPIEACKSCNVQDYCSGVDASYLATWGPPAAKPLRDDRARRRLSVLRTVDEQIARELVSPNLHTPPGGVATEEDIVRVNFNCNQACRFCFVSTHLPSAADGAIFAAIDRAVARGARVTLSGGEPTLNPRLAEFIRYAQSRSPHAVQLQTNAVRLADAALLGRLIEAGLTEAFVSLHGSNAQISDTVTCAPGTFEKTVLGLDNLARSGVIVVINYVLCQTNAGDFPAFVRLVAERWPSATISVSFVAASSDVVPRERDFIPRYTDALPALAAGMAIAEQAGVRLGGFESMCGIPLCLVPAPLEGYVTLATLPDGFDQGEFVHTETCNGCALRSTCFGLRRGYIEMHGAGEIRAVASSPAS